MSMGIDPSRTLNAKAVVCCFFFQFLVVNTDLMTLYSIEVTNGSKVNDNMVIDLVIPVVH